RPRRPRRGCSGGCPWLFPRGRRPSSSLARRSSPTQAFWHVRGQCRKVSGSSMTFDMPLFSGSWGEARGVIEFKGVHYPKSVILYAVFFYVRYAVSYRDLEEILGERGVTVDHATLNRWVVKFAPLIAARAQARK